MKQIKNIEVVETLDMTSNEVANVIAMHYGIEYDGVKVEHDGSIRMIIKYTKVDEIDVLDTIDKQMNAMMR